ncbi:MAG TPA: DUF58 domain-containing protein [Nocardioidaceae bacterium]|jgi:uncharacterized protein (DUF58 family)|nr:DUF58 domain-containing protein [Nocardioidaceae bacterium]
MREALNALTTRGRAFLAAGLTTAVCAVLLGYDALLRVGILAAAIPLLTALLLSKARYRLRADRSVVPGRVAVGDTATVSLQLANQGRLPMGLVLLEDRIPYALGTRPRFMVDHAGRRWVREVTYPVRSDTRGHYEVGPLSVRVSDPFGMIELVRTFSATTRLIVTPTVHQLPSIGTSGEWSGTGDRRPRAFATGTAEDVTVREYRLGDDLRRVHWASTARTGDLMVRREEQPWQSRATVLLDTRRMAHAGNGPGASLEWAVTAASSVAVHLARTGFSVRLITDHPDVEAATWHDHALTPQAQAAPVLDQLSVLTPSDRLRLSEATQAVTRQPGLLVAVLGRLDAHDVLDVSRALPAATRGIAILLDTDAWQSGTAGRHGGRDRARVEPSPGEPARHHAAMLSTAGWTPVIAGPGDSIADIWQRLGSQLNGVYIAGSAVPR